MTTVGIRARRSAQQKARLLAVAMDLFYRQGLHSVGVDLIARTAEVTKPTLYRHFPSKAVLEAACAAQWVALAEKEPAPAGLEANRGTEDRLETFLRDFARRLDAPGYRGCPITSIAVDIAMPDHPGWLAIRTYRERRRSCLTDTAARSGLVAPASLAEGLILLMEGASIRRRSEPSSNLSAGFLESAQVLIDHHQPVTTAA